MKGFSHNKKACCCCLCATLLDTSTLRAACFKYAAVVSNAHTRARSFYCSYFAHSPAPFFDLAVSLVFCFVPSLTFSLPVSFTFSIPSSLHFPLAFFTVDFFAQSLFSPLFALAFSLSFSLSLRFSFFDSSIFSLATMNTITPKRNDNQQHKHTTNENKR